jgi:hypothetical protein
MQQILGTISWAIHYFSNKDSNTTANEKFSCEDGMQLNIYNVYKKLKLA